MAEYIDRKVAIERFQKIKESGVSFNDAIYLDGVMAVLENIPASDVAPVVHGKWVGYDASYYRYYTEGAYPVNLIRYKCSVCGSSVPKRKPYCHCGAKMDL